MNHDLLKPTVLASALTAVALPATVTAADAASLDSVIARIKAPNPQAQTEAWQQAAAAGAPAIKPLAALLNDGETEVRRAAQRALWQIVRHAGRPGADKAAQAASGELAAVLATGTSAVRRDALWMLSEIGGDTAVAPMATLLSDPEVREDACLALQRMPGRKATAALKKSFPSAPEDFKLILAQTLRIRGEKVSGYPSRKLTPTKPTSVK